MKIFHIGISANGKPYNGLQRALSKYGEYEEIYCGEPGLNRRIPDIMKGFQPDMVFMQVQAGNVVRPDTMRVLKQAHSNAFIVNWTGDVRHPIPAWYLEMGKEIDITLFSSMTDVWEARRLGVTADYLQIGVDPEIYHPAPPKTAWPEIVFLGNNYGNQFPLSKLRKDTVKFLRDNYGNQFRAYGSGWQEYGYTSLMGDQYAEADCYRGCKIAINLSHFDYERYSSDRMFRIMATGSFCLTKTFPGIHLDFEDKKNVATWVTLADLKYYIDYYLENEEERKGIADNGCRLAHDNFTFDKMVQNLIKIYENAKV